MIEEVERWKSIAEANDRSYRIAVQALEQTREQVADLKKQLREMTTYRDNAKQREEWALTDVRRLKAELAREKKARRALQPRKAKTKAGAKKRGAGERRSHE